MKMISYLFLTILLFISAITEVIASERFNNTGINYLIDNSTDLAWLKYANSNGPENCLPNSKILWSNVQNFINCLNSNSYLGYSDWRLPSLEELQSLTNGGATPIYQWLASQGFVNVENDCYWSATDHNEHNAFGICMNYGDVNYLDKQAQWGGFWVWPVRTNNNTTLPPIANAGANSTYHVGSLATLDASGSSDPSGNGPLTYAWSFQSVPAGSFATLSDPTSLHPTFTPDKIGDYVVQLVVTNNAGTASGPVTVTVSTQNTVPNSDAGPDQFVTAIGSTVTLDGSRSYDVDGDALTYQWALTAPSGSSAILNNPTAATPTFVVDVHGTYIATLIVSDPWSSSAAKQTTVSFSNVQPVANAGTSDTVILYDTVLLNGSLSNDANGDNLTYRWAITTLPQGSTTSLFKPASQTPSFVADQIGTYVVQLIVNDGFIDSAPSTVEINAITFSTKATQDIQMTVRAPIAAIDTTDPTIMKNPMLQNALLNKLNAIISNISSGNYQTAIDQLVYDVLAKTDGCAKSGAPDNNDWIKDCATQAEIYPSIMAIIEELKTHQ